MWKRNGYSLLNQLYFYQNVRCRTDMMDKDVVALQIGASLIEANEFLLHVINRFDLFQWADQAFYDRVCYKLLTPKLTKLSIHSRRITSVRVKKSCMVNFNI